MMTNISCCHNSSSVEYTFLTFPLLQIHYDTLIRHESFQFFNWFPFFWISYYHFIIEQSAPNCSKWVYLFNKFPGGTPARYFPFSHRNPLPCLINVLTNWELCYNYCDIKSSMCLVIIISPVHYQVSGKSISMATCSSTRIKDDTHWSKDLLRLLWYYIPYVPSYSFKVKVTTNQILLNLS